MKKRYLREMMAMRRGAEETDEENDKEVEQVLARAWRYDSDTASSHSE